MTIIQLPVPNKTAQRFQPLSEQQQALISQLVATCLAESNSLTDVMDYLSFKVARRGLTSEMPED